jgi:hypothetical protein
LSHGAVCRGCNNGLAHLDQAVIDEFDIPAFIAGVRRKRGKPPVIRTRGNMISGRDESGKMICINMEPHPVGAPDGARIPPRGKSKRNVDATIQRNGERAAITYRVRFGESPKFVRGIVKIAFSSLAFFVGPTALCDTKYDSIRAFVTKGMGQRAVLVMAVDDTDYRTQAWGPYQNERGDYVIVFRLAMAEFAVDLSPDMSLLSMLKNSGREFLEDGTWCILPR